MKPIQENLIIKNIDNSHSKLKKKHSIPEFLMGSSDAAKKIHWIGWHKVAKPKEEGGLGLQTARGRNVALLAKLN